MRSSVLAFLEKSGVQIPEKHVLKSLLKLSYLTEPQLEVLLIELGSANLGRKTTVWARKRAEKIIASISNWLIGLGPPIV